MRDPNFNNNEFRKHLKIMVNTSTKTFLTWFLNHLSDVKTSLNGAYNRIKSSDTVAVRHIIGLLKKAYSTYKEMPWFAQKVIFYSSIIIFIMLVQFLFSIYTKPVNTALVEIMRDWGSNPEANAFHYDLWDEMFGPEEPEPTWWERIKYKIFGEPEEAPEPYRTWDENLERFYTRWNVHQCHRDFIEHVLNPPEPSGLDKLKIEIRLWLKDLFDALWIWIKQTAVDTWNLSKFFAEYTDKKLRYVFDSIPISESTWDYLTLLGVSICCLNYMYTLMRYDPVLYTRVMFLEFRHIPIREIHFFHEYFLCWSTIIVCLLLFTQVN